MKTVQELRNMDEEELRNLVLELQHRIRESGIDEFKSSCAHVYHFSSEELLKLNRERFIGSGVIVSMHDTKGRVLMKPTCFKDGFSNSSINSLLDDMQYTYDSAIEYKPSTKRLGVDANTPKLK